MADTKTPASAPTPYCDAAGFLDFFDARTVGDLVRDDNTRATESELLTDPKLAAALGAASGQVEQTALMADTYTAADLQALAGNGAYRLKQMVARLAYGGLLERRGVSDVPRFVQDAQADLEALARGARIFPFVETAAAGLPATSPFNQADFDQIGLISRNIRAFGVRSSRRWRTDDTQGY